MASPDSGWRVVETPPTSAPVEPERATASPENLPPALEASASMLPRRRWDQPSEAPMLRGPNYMEDGRKVAALGGPCFALFGCQLM